MNAWIDNGEIIWGEKENIEDWEHLLCDTLTVEALEDDYKTNTRGPWMILE